MCNGARRAKSTFHRDYRTAGEVRDNYLSDLSSETGKRKTAELEQLHVPSLPQLKDDFLELCSQLWESRPCSGRERNVERSSTHEIFG